ncbi:MAG: hypothetical protein FWH25_03230, partial [Syntrophorhabdaceae bacterium]|nr:hypothetical protein [Syntrophorhabdaceae bacterium]
NGIAFWLKLVGDVRESGRHNKTANPLRLTRFSADFEGRPPSAGLLPFLPVLILEKVDAADFL